MQHCDLAVAVCHRGARCVRRVERDDACADGHSRAMAANKDVPNGASAALVQARIAGRRRGSGDDGRAWAAYSSLSAVSVPSSVGIRQVSPRPLRFLPQPHERGVVKGE
jgi:hypothetical protein